MPTSLTLWQNAGVELHAGDRVRNPARPEWGQGVVATSPAAGKVCVLFREAGEKVLSLRHAKLDVLGADAPADPWLEAMRFDDTRSGRPYVGPREAMGIFTARYPEGFRDPLYLEKERRGKLEARELVRRELSSEALAAGPRTRRLEQTCELALRALARSGVVFPGDRTLLRRALAKPAGRGRFAAALDDLLHGRGAPDGRFLAFAETLGELDAGRWTLATAFPFLANPGEWMLVRPTELENAAALFRFELGLRPEIDRSSYGRVLAMARVVGASIAELEPADLFDVQAFLQTVAADAG